MKRILSVVGAILSTGVLAGTVTGPDGRLAVSVETDSPGDCIAFKKSVPTTWDETCFLMGRGE